MSPLKWHVMGHRRWDAWSHEDGTFSPFLFQLQQNDLGTRLDVADVRRKGRLAPYGVPILRLSFDHREWTFEQMRAFVEQVRPLLPTFDGDQEWTTEEILERHRQQLRMPARCQFVHAFPLGADDGTACQCGRVTKGWLKQQAS